MFENIECEWPLFFCYFYIDATFREDKRDVCVAGAGACMLCLLLLGKQV